METSKLKKFAQYARRYLIEQVSAKLKFVLAAESAARRENPKAVQDLEKQIQATSQDRVIEKIAYIWFNRFCALRFMDANRYTIIGIVSPAEGQFQPEILADAKMGHIDEAMVPDKTRQQVFALLGGSAPSPDPQQEAYSLLLVAICNYYNTIMPFMFEKIADYTELLMPDDLLSGNSILAYTREAMTPDACKDVEVIGWLYQFYISEKKDEVFEGLKKNKKITPENIPAATQLFTPHWIVRYLVENSLGRLWMLNRPNSRLIERMDYYIKPEVPENDFLKISKPEEIKLCDPASGSAHMLTYSFDLFYAIYEEEGYDANEIPRLILENNLFGIEIDERAGELAAFALTMKAREKYKRFLTKPVQPNICVLQNIHFEDGELKRYMDAIGRDLFTANLQTLLHQFEEADNFGSLIRPELADAEAILKIVEEKKLTSDLFLRNTHERVLLSLKQADYLSPKYHVVVTNPPYMGGKGMNGRLGAWAKDNYPTSKSDLFAMFFERGFALVTKLGYSAMVTMQSWMFLSSYENFRRKVVSKNTLLCLAHFGAGAFPEIGGQAVQVAAFVVKNFRNDSYIPVFGRYDIGNSDDKHRALMEKRNLYRNYKMSDFYNFPSASYAYWVSGTIFKSFASKLRLEDVLSPRQGMATSDNNRFLRYSWEVSKDNICKEAKDRASAAESGAMWFPYNKGGAPIKWYGNQEYVVNWHKDGADILSYAAELYGSPTRTIKNISHYFKKGITWSDITFKNAKGEESFAARISPGGFIFDVKGSSGFPDEGDILPVLCMLNSKVLKVFMSFMNPSSTFQVGDIRKIPYMIGVNDKRLLYEIGEQALDKAKGVYNGSELSWDFTSLPLLNPAYRQSILKATYQKLRAHWRDMTIEMQRLEEENNRILIEAYGLRDELAPEVPLNEITLTCNPHYRYGGGKSEEELEALLLADTMKEFISYAVGCMFGRYSLDKPGLILANQGETIADFIRKVTSEKTVVSDQWPVASEKQENTNHCPLTTVHLSFVPDHDNAIPVLDEGWFVDDIVERFRKFLKVSFGEEHYEENLSFIEEAIGKDIRKYFFKDFYNEHLKRYKKRPIYWLFSSPKGSFNALIYMHRYRPDTVSIVLNDYLREFRTKLSSGKDNLEQISISASASQREKTQALKDIEKLRKMIEELEEYEREIMYPLATKQINIDLDDGVKVNYLKFGDALKKIPGLEAKEED